MATDVKIQCRSDVTSKTQHQSSSYVSLFRVKSSCPFSSHQNTIFFYYFKQKQLSHLKEMFLEALLKYRVCVGVGGRYIDVVKFLGGIVSTL